MYDIDLAKQLIKIASNPLEAIRSMPNGQHVMDMIQDRDPKEVFYSECNKRGIDAEQIIKMIGEIR